MLPPTHVIDSIERIQGFRGWLLSSYAQIEFLFSDLVHRCCAIEEYRELGDELPFPVVKRLRRARKILETQGALSAFADRLVSVLDRFELDGNMRNILAHGHMTVLHDPNGTILYEFRKWHWNGDGPPAELIHRCLEGHLDYEAAQLSALAQEASVLFSEVHGSLGWSAE